MHPCATRVPTLVATQCDCHGEVFKAQKGQGDAAATADDAASDDATVHAAGAVAAPVVAANVAGAAAAAAAAATGGAVVIIVVVIGFRDDEFVHCPPQESEHSAQVARVPLAANR